MLKVVKILMEDLHELAQQWILSRQNETQLNTQCITSSLMDMLCDNVSGREIGDLETLISQPLPWL